MERERTEQRLRTYSDETVTGAERTELRNMSRITIAAKCASVDSFEWLERFRRDFLRGALEVKSTAALAVAATNDRARRFLLDHIAEATIAIIDVAEHTRNLFRGILAKIGFNSDAVHSTVKFLRTGQFPEEVGRDILLFARQQDLQRTAVGRIEDLLEIAASKSGLPRSPADKLFKSEVLTGLKNQEFEELVARFSIALGDAIDPTVQANTIAQLLGDCRYLHEGHIATAVLEQAVQPERIFDVGSMNAFKALQDANDIVVHAIDSFGLSTDAISPGLIRQDDSRKLLGLQAADLACGYARHVFETDYSGTTEAASAVRRVFSRVLLNDQWIAS